MSATDDGAGDIPQNAEDVESVSGLESNSRRGAVNNVRRSTDSDSERSSQLELQLASTKHLLDTANKRLAAYHRSVDDGELLHCSRGSDGDYCSRPIFFLLSERTITHEPLHAAR